MTRWMLDFARLGVLCGLVLVAAQTVFAAEQEGQEEQTYGLRITVEDGDVKIEQTGSEDLQGLPEQLSEQIKQAMQQVGDATGKVRVEAKAMVRDDDGNLKEVPVETIIKTLQDELGRSLNLEALKDMGLDVNVWVDDEKDGDGQQKRVIIKKMVGGDDAEHNVMKNIIVKALGGDGAAEGEIDVDVQMLVDGEHEGHDGKPRKVIIKRMKTRDGGDVELLEKIGGLRGDLRAAEGGPVTWVGKGDGDDDENIFIMEGPWSPRMDAPLPRSTHRLGVAIEGTAGVVVSQVGDDTAASKAGLKAGDIVLRVNGDTISGVAALIRQVNEAGESDSPLTLTVVRDDEVLEVTAEPRRVEDDHHAHEHDDDQAHDHAHDHEGHEHADQDDEHADQLREMRERARGMAEEAQQRARRQVAEARRNVERRAREMQQQAREIERARRNEVRELREEISELREMIGELAEEMKDRD